MCVGKENALCRGVVEKTPVEPGWLRQVCSLSFWVIETLVMISWAAFTSCGSQGGEDKSPTYKSLCRHGQHVRSTPPSLFWKREEGTTMKIFKVHDGAMHCLITVHKLNQVSQLVLEPSLRPLAHP